jgi:hypothetical protein
MPTLLLLYTTSRLLLASAEPLYKAHLGRTMGDSAERSRMPPPTLALASQPPPPSERWKWDLPKAQTG